MPPDCDGLRLTAGESEAVYSGVADHTEDTKMHIHRDVSDIVNGKVLRDVIQIHGMEIPYSAELWVDGTRHHEDGTAMFSIGDRGYLTAEYFGYDVADPLEWLGMGLKRLESKLILKDTRVEIPISWIRSSPKARTWHNVPMPAITAYRCEIQGRLGDFGSEMKSVSMTVAGLPDIHLGQITTRLPEETTSIEHLTLHGFKKQIGQLNMEAAEWQINLTPSYVENEDGHPLHHVLLSRKDASPFSLPDDIDNSVINALRLFFSFQCAKWVDLPTIVCNPVFSITKKHLVLSDGETDEEVLRAVRKLMGSEAPNPWAMYELNCLLQSARIFDDVSGADILGVSASGEQATMTFGKGNPTVRQAWVSRLASRDGSTTSTWTATDTRAWHSLFEGFWNQYTETNNREHLRNSLHHYVEANQILDEGSIGQSLVAAQSTLQALTRWWNGLRLEAKFEKWDAGLFKEELVKAVCNAELGKDSGVVIDEKSLQASINKAADYRNDIDHGRVRKTAGQEQAVIYCTRHHLNLARLLILAKFGNRDRDARGCLAGPLFTQMLT